MAIGPKQALYLLAHPVQLRSIIQWKLWHEPVHKRDPSKEPDTVKSCFHFLDLTSRSFSAVIQELTPELLLPVCLFYLVLRGLDTIEDDMTIPIEEKEPLLRNFKQYMETDGWTFDKNGPDEKDRELLVHFDDVIVELKKVKRPYYDIIADITVKMGNGMADYALNAELNANGVQSVEEYEEYCHYVAGLVGDGLTRLFVEAKLANPHLLGRPIWPRAWASSCKRRTLSAMSRRTSVTIADGGPRISGANMSTNGRISSSRRTVPRLWSAPTRWF